MTDYEQEFRKNPRACGDPFADVVSFFDGLSSRDATVLDLGCGQGRDALMIAERGFEVVGVDISPSGISQMIEQARNQDLKLTGEVADLLDYMPDKRFDISVLDRVVHMFPSESDKLLVISKAAEATLDSGTVVLVDTPKNMPTIDRFFENRPGWETAVSKKGFRVFTACGSTA